MPALRWVSRSVLLLPRCDVCLSPTPLRGPKHGLQALLVLQTAVQYRLYCCCAPSLQTDPLLVPVLWMRFAPWQVYEPVFPQQMLHFYETGEMKK